MVWQAADATGLRRRRAADAPPGRGARCRPPRASASSSSARAGCATWSSPCSCCSSCTGAPTRRCAARNTLEALEALSTYGYVGRDDAAELDRAYRFLRTVEHRLQLHRLRRTHVMPDDEDELRRLGRSIGLRTDAGRGAGRRSGASTRARCAGCTRSCSTGRCCRRWRGWRPDEARLTPEAAPVPAGGPRLRGPGRGAAPPRGADGRGEPTGGDPADPAAGAARLVRRRAGPGRRAARLPAAQRRARHDARGTSGCCATRERSRTGWRCCSRAAGTPSTCSAARRRRCACSRTTPTWLLAAGAELLAEVRAALARHDDPATAVGVARGVRRRELFRVAAADLLELASVEQVEEALTDVAAVTVQAALDVAVRVGARRRVASRCRPGWRSSRWAGSAATSSATPATPTCSSCTTRSTVPTSGTRPRRRTRSCRSCAGCSSCRPRTRRWSVDADLRPEGRRARWCARSRRTRPTTSAGRSSGRARRCCVPSRSPATTSWASGSSRSSTRCATATGGLDEADVREIRRIKARVEAERLPRGADPQRHTKLGPGGLADVEWTVQLLQLRHAAEVPGLRTTRTLAALRAAAAQGLLGDEQADVLAHAWRIGQPGAQRDPARPRPAGRQPARPTCASSPAWRGCWATLRARQARWSTTTVARPGGPGRWWSRCSTGDALARDTARVVGTTYRDALRNSEFRGLVVAQVASEWGDNIARVALASLVLSRTDSAFLAVLAFVVSFVPGRLRRGAARHCGRPVPAQGGAASAATWRAPSSSPCSPSSRSTGHLCGSSSHCCSWRRPSPRRSRRRTARWSRTCWPSPARSSPAPG